MLENGDYRWLTVQRADRPCFKLGIFSPESTIPEAETNARRCESVAQVAVPPLLLAVVDCPDRDALLSARR